MNRLVRAERVRSDDKDDLRSSVREVLLRFMRWLDAFGWESYDQYDFWATAYGKISKGAYYRHGILAAPLVVPPVITDLLWPSARRVFCRKKRFAIADAHFAMGFVNLYELTGDRSHLQQAEELADHLYRTALPGFSGLCWGYPFDWQTKRGLWKSSVPFVTSTPYVFDAFVALHRATQNPVYAAWAESVTRFVADDIRHMKTNGRGKAASYTPLDDAWVVNASAYRAACLADASVLFNEPRYREMAEENACFILEQQRPDGSWFYSASDPHDQFIDHFHTCFVLKGLWRTYAVTGNAALLQAIGRGYEYYRRNLFRADGTPRPFAEGYPAQFRVRELYDYAEAVNLHLLLSAVVPDATATSDFLVRQIVERWVTSSGYFITRQSRGGLVNRVPYHRWAQSQTFRSLAVWLRGAAQPCAV